MSREDETELPEGTDLHSDVRAAFAEVRAAEEANATPTDESNAKVEPASEPGDGAEAKTDEPKSEPEPKPETKDDNKPDETKDDDEQKLLDAPARWTKEEKEEFEKLDAKAREILFKRNKSLEAAWTKKNQELADQRKSIDGLQESLAPIRESGRQLGMNEAQFANYLNQQWQMANTNPQQFIEAFAQQRGLDLPSMYAPSPDEIMRLIEQYGEEQDGPSAQPRTDPAIMRELEALRAQNAQLAPQVQAITTQLSGYQQAQNQAFVDAAKREFEAFAAATDTNGQPLYPLLEDVRGDMAKLFNNGMASDLKDAYEKAVWSRADTRQKLQESEDIRRQRESARRAQEEAAKAKRASSAVSGSSTSLSPSYASSDDDWDKLTLRQQIARTIAEQQVERL